MTNEPKTDASASSTVSTSVRNWLIGATLFLAAAIAFGLLYLFVIAPSVPSGSVGWFLFSFATGLTMIIMPCTLPLAFVIVPLSMGKGLVRGLSIALAFGLGIAATLSLYGIIAAVVGDVVLDTLGADMETLKNWVYFIAGIFALTFAMSEIGLLNFHMPTYSGAAPAFIQNQQEVIKAFFLGLFLGNVGVGCPHPATPLILIEIATSGDILYGWLMFLIHAIGRILPLLLLAFLAILGVNGLSWLMTRKAVLERVTGWAMVFVAGFILTLGLFSHDWWVNSGIHSALESLTQESRFNSLMNETLGTNVAHVHGLETGTGLFGQPLEWGNWFLVLVWLIPMWWWYSKKRKAMEASPAFKIRALEAQIDKLESERRVIEATVKLDDLETQFDLSSTQTEIDALEKARREEEAKVEFGEVGVYKSAVAREYEGKVLSMRRNYLFVISIFLILIFTYFLPQNFYFKSMSGLGHGDSHGTGSTHDHGSAPVSQTSSLTSPTMSEDTTGLPLAQPPQFITLKNGDTYTITAGYVAKKVGDKTLRMMAYNGSVPGPFIRVNEGGEVKIVFVNNTDIDQTIHSHGVRMDNNYDGTPAVTQNVVKPGETFSYILKFPDVGIAWYHPHTRDDIGQEMGLYGNYFIEPLDNDYYSPVNRELPLVVDDILLESDGTFAPFFVDYVDHALLGRFGNLYFVNGELDYTLNAVRGEVIRFFVTNVANARTYRLSIPGAMIKRVAAEGSKFESETYEDELILAPAERLIVEVYFPNSGTFKLVNRKNDGAEEVARFVVQDNQVSPSYAKEFLSARKDLSTMEEFNKIRSHFSREPDKKLRLTVALEGNIDHSTHSHSSEGSQDHSSDHNHGTMANHGAVDHHSMPTMMNSAQIDSIQWSDPTNSDAVNTTKNVEWILLDETSNKKNMNIPISDWTFKEGQLVKIRITNDVMAAHVMQHPIHLHGQRFVVLAENGIPNENMAWKDTAMVLPGGTMDILVDMSNLGEWMLHCHIVEHLFAGMMLQFRVENENGYATGDEYRAKAAISNEGDPKLKGNEDSSMTTTTFSWSSQVNDTNIITIDKPKYKMGSPEYVAFTFRDANGKSLALDKNRQVPLTVTFVSEDDKDHFTSYPGNTSIHQRGNMMDANIPGSKNFDESKPHSHSLSFPVFAQTVYADAGHAHTAGTMPEGYAPVYSVPAYFSQLGNYKAFVEYYLEGDTKPFVGVVQIIVGPASWSIDNYGWSDSKLKTVLGIISLLLMIPLCLYVRRYINKPI